MVKFCPCKQINSYLQSAKQNVGLVGLLLTHTRRHAHTPRTQGEICSQKKKEFINNLHSIGKYGTI